MSKTKDTRLTPDWLLERVTDLLGPGWFDPCPPFGVKGLIERWPEDRPAYCNPPGSAKLDFARKFSEWHRQTNLPGAYLHFDWDHSTRHWKEVDRETPTYVLFNKRMKMRGPAFEGQKESEWPLFDVGRSHGLAIVGVKRPVILAVFSDVGVVLS